MRTEGYLKRQKRRNMFLGIFIVAIMVLSILGYSAFQQQGDQTTVYGRYSFSLKNDLWTTKIDKAEYEFNFLPADVDIIPMDEFDFEPALFYVVSNPKANYSKNDLTAIEFSKYELRTKLSKYFGYQGYPGFTEKYLDNAPITCTNATPSVAVIEFIIGNETKISYSGNCITLTGRSGTDIVQMKDLFLYKESGIINAIGYK